MTRHVAVLTLGLLAAALTGCRDKDSKLHSAAASPDASLERVKKAGALLWGADVVGGIPYVYEDPKNPGTYIGFEMDLSQAIAQQLGVQVKLVIRAWDTLIPELQRGTFDLAMNGIEDTEERSKYVMFSQPYFIYSQQLTVRADSKGIRSLDDLSGKRVATLTGTAAEDILRARSGIQVIAHPECIYSYSDLERGQVDAVLLDTPIAAAYGAANPKLKNVGESFGEGRYVIAFRTEDRSLCDAVNVALETLKTSGQLRAVYQRWGIMDQHQIRIGIQ